MNIKRKTLLLAMSAVIWFGAGLQGSFAASKVVAKSKGAVQSDTARTISGYFTPVTPLKKYTRCQRIYSSLVDIGTDQQTESGQTRYLPTATLEKHSQPSIFPNQFTILPKNGETVKAGDQELKWHALDSKNYNVKLFRFAYGLRKQIYGVLFWTVTVVNSPREMKNVRMAVGSNSGSMWWLNGKEAVLLSGDRRMVVDDCVSTRLTLNKGKNIIRGAVINGPGMSDFCVRFLDENGKPIKDITITNE